MQITLKIALLPQSYSLWQSIQHPLHGGQCVAMNMNPRYIYVSEIIQTKTSKPKRLSQTMSRVQSIRIATSDDCERIAEIYNHYLGKSTMDLESKDADYYQKILHNQGRMEEIWVTENQEVTGWGIIKKYSDRKGYQYTGETSVYMAPEYVGKGFGGRLKKHLMNRCKELGYHHLLARIFTENEVSINYNLKMGYTVVGVQKEAGNINGQWKDVTILQYLIK